MRLVRGHEVGSRKQHPTLVKRKWEVETVWLAAESGERLGTGQGGRKDPQRPR